MSRYKSQITEVINRNTLVSLAVAKGYNAFLPVYDGGVDFILYNEANGDIRKVQLKGRWTIDEKYVDRDIWIAFSQGDRWYLAPHDKMVDHAHAYGYTKSVSWMNGTYSVKNLTKAMIIDLAEYEFGDIEQVAEEAAEASKQNKEFKAQTIAATARREKATGVSTK